MASSLLLSPLPLSSPKSHRINHSFAIPARTRTHLLPSPPNASKNSNNNNSAADPPDRIIAAACYLYPFLDGVQYGRYVLTQFPVFQLPLQPLIPVIRLFKSFPLNSFLLFLALYFAVVRNPSSFSRYVRFNTMQAIVLNVLLVFPDLIKRGFSPSGGFGLDLVMSLDSTVFLFLLVCLVYGSTSCLLGQLPRLPIVADAADRLLCMQQKQEQLEYCTHASRSIVVDEPSTVRVTGGVVWQYGIGLVNDAHNAEVEELGKDRRPNEHHVVSHLD